MKQFITIIICLLGYLFVSAAETGQQIFQPKIQTLSVSNPNDFLSPPVIRIGSSDRLNINFDLICDQHEYLRFRLIHCNADWQPSRLMESEYLGAFNEFQIEDYAYSSNTYIHYINYNISLPDPQIPILMSGNYLLQVFPENNPDEILLQARFAVSEEIALVNGNISTRTDKGVNTSYQQLFLNIDGAALGDYNPYQDLIVEIVQNNTPATSRIISHPIRINGSTVVFEHAPELIFEASNEFRRFETVRVDYPGMHVNSVEYGDGMWKADLVTDYSRKDKGYIYDSTQNGRFKIDEYNSSDPDLSADYILVDFSLDPGEKTNGPIFVDGDFTNHTYTDRNLMKYDWNDGLYHAKIPLKQGSYNYQYVVIPENGGLPSPAPIEGNKYETQNQYLIKVFLRLPGSRADRLVGSFLL